MLSTNRKGGSGEYACNWLPTGRNVSLLFGCDRQGCVLDGHEYELFSCDGNVTLSMNDVRNSRHSILLLPLLLLHVHKQSNSTHKDFMNTNILYV